MVIPFFCGTTLSDKITRHYSQILSSTDTTRTAEKAINRPPLAVLHPGVGLVAIIRALRIACFVRFRYCMRLFERS